MKTPISKLALVFMVMISLSFAMHKHYISLTRIDYAPEDKALQITMRFFIDDLEKAVGTRYGTELKLGTDEEIEQSNLLIERYLQQKFSISVNEEPKTHAFLGKQYENDEVFFFLEIEGIEQIETLSVQNSMLFEVFEEQQNYVKINVNDIKKTFILVKANDKEMLNLKTAR